jgi:hypothetical protein
VGFRVWVVEFNSSHLLFWRTTPYTQSPTPQAVLALTPFYPFGILTVRVLFTENRDT